MRTLLLVILLEKTPPQEVVVDTSLRDEGVEMCLSSHSLIQAEYRRASFLALTSSLGTI